MIPKFSTIIIIAILSLNVMIAHAANIFYSSSGIGGSSVNEDLILNLDSGDSAKIYIYFDFFSSTPTPSDLDTIELNYATSSSGIVNFTATEMLDFSVASGGYRWGYNSGAPIPSSLRGF